MVLQVWVNSKEWLVFLRKVKVCKREEREVS